MQWAIDWVRVKDEMPPGHQNLLFLCTNGDVYQGRPCYGMHAPWFCGHSTLNFGVVLSDHGLDVEYWAFIPKTGKDGDAQ